MHLAANTPSIWYFGIRLIDNKLRFHHVVFNLFSTSFFVKSIELRAQYACFNGAIACWLSTNWIHLRAISPCFCGKILFFLANQTPVCSASAYWFFPDWKFSCAVLRAKNRQNILQFCRVVILVEYDKSRTLPALNRTKECDRDMQTTFPTTRPHLQVGASRNCAAYKFKGWL